MAAIVSSEKRKYLRRAQHLKKQLKLDHRESFFGHQREWTDAHSDQNGNALSRVVLDIEEDEVVSRGPHFASPSPLTGQILAPQSPPLATSDASGNSSSQDCVQCNEVTFQNRKLSLKLDAQRKANLELKRLLVASVGDDINSKFERVANEKAQLSVDLEATLQRLTEDWEEIERLAIESDLWRSKYVGSRFMLEELVQWKDALAKLLQDSHFVMKDLVLQQNQMSELLVKVWQNLLKTHSVFQRSRQCQSAEKVNTSLTNLSLAESALSLSQDLYTWVSHSTSLPWEPLCTVQDTLTDVKVRQLLSHQLDLLDSCNSSVSIESSLSSTFEPFTPRLPSLMKTFKSFLSSRDNHCQVTFRCHRCKGDIFIV